MAGVGVQAFADHHPGFGPSIGIGYASDPRRDGAVAVQRLIGKAEGVGVSPNVGPGPFEGVNPVRIAGTSRQPHAAHVAAKPGARQRWAQC